MSAGLHDEVGNDAVPAHAVEVAPIDQLQEIGHRQRRPLRIQPHDDRALRRADAHARMFARHRAVEQRGRRRAQREVEPRVARERTTERRGRFRGSRHRARQRRFRIRRGGQRGDDADGNGGQLVGALAPGEHAHAFRRLFAHPPRRIAQQHHPQRRQHRRIFASRDEIGELNAHELVAVGEARLNRGRRRLGRKAAAQRPGDMPAHRRHTLAGECCRQTLGDRTPIGSLVPADERRCRARPNDRIAIACGEGQQRLVEGRGPRRGAGLRTPGGVNGGEPHGSRPIPESQGNRPDVDVVLSSQETVTVNRQGTKRNVPGRGRVL